MSNIAIVVVMIILAIPTWHVITLLSNNKSLGMLALAAIALYLVVSY
jgi:hypothetical protein